MNSCTKFLTVTLITLASALSVQAQETTKEPLNLKQIQLASYFGPVLFNEDCPNCAEDFIRNLGKEAPSLLNTMEDIVAWILPRKDICEGCVQLGDSKIVIEKITAAKESDKFGFTLSVRWGDCMMGCVNKHTWTVDGRIYKNTEGQKPYVWVQESGTAVPLDWKQR